jgi:hypothetical protein
MAPIVVRFQIDARVEWKFARDSQSERWIGVCAALKVTAEADTWGEFCQTINEIQNELFRDLLEEGELQSFLLQHGWNPLTPIPSQPTNVVFDMPAFMIPAAANDRTREIRQ